MSDLMIRNGNVYSEGQLVEVDLLVSDGKVKQWMAPGAPAPGDAKEIDAAGLWVLPGLIDAHFHCRAPAYSEREDFGTGSQAAAAAGVTTYFEMPISTPGVSNGKVLKDRQELAEKESYVDFGLYAAPGTLDPNDVNSAVEAGAIGFKIFLHAAPPERLDEFTGICITDDGDLFRALKMVAATGRVCSVHAEDETILQEVAAELGDDIRTDPEGHLSHRPPVVENYASARVLALSEHSGVKIHLAHISTGFVAEMVELARANGIDASAETCPHYVEFDNTVMKEFGPFGKVNPPIRGGEDKKALRAAVRRGAVDILVSDHSPFTMEEKEVGMTDIRKAPSGAPGIEMSGRYYLDQALRGEFPLDIILNGLTINPARRFGIDAQKGHLLPGADADFLLFDPDGETTIDINELKTKSRKGAQMWDGRTFKGRLLSTWLRGNLVYDDGEIVGPAGAGRLVRPQ